MPRRRAAARPPLRRQRARAAPCPAAPNTQHAAACESTGTMPHGASHLARQARRTRSVCLARLARTACAGGTGERTHDPRDGGSAPPAPATTATAAGSTAGSRRIRAARTRGESAPSRPPAASCQGGVRTPCCFSCHQNRLAHEQYVYLSFFLISFFFAGGWRQTS